jgi:osmotically-inducible protein OsmY
MACRLPFSNSSISTLPSTRHLGVAVREGFVTLSGHVPSLLERAEAERVAGRVKGVKAIVNQIVVELPGHHQTSDERLAEQAYARLASNLTVPASRVHLAVNDGVVRLHGDVDWHYQRQAAIDDLLKLPGVRGIETDIAVKPPVKAERVQKRIHDALASLTLLDADLIQVSAEGTEVTLSGEVTSWHEKGLAERTAWCVPGVSQVNNLIKVV